MGTFREAPAELNTHRVRNYFTTFYPLIVSNQQPVNFIYMKNHLLICVLFFSFALFSCADEHLPLNVNRSQRFEGSFKLETDDKSLDQSGTSTLEIAGGVYKNSTYNGMVYAAGKLTATENKITFSDTVFKIYPANIIPPRSLNGTYDYAFDGNKLQIGNKYSSGWVETHTFYLKK